MFVSRLTFLTLPGKTAELEQELKTLREIVKGGGREYANSAYAFCLS
jgi:hypothetical protein